jgi:uncharacterized protein (TIGR02646 family)
MRPVNKGVAPRAYADYKEAGPDLQDRLGNYCSYCERYIETHLAIEHIQPKSLNPGLAADWANFLLGCSHCNSCKGAVPINVADYYWPDSDNTLRALAYLPGGLVIPNPARSPTEQAKAQATIRLVGLDKDPGNPDLNRMPTKSDRRWRRRAEVWALAIKDKDRLAKHDTDIVRELIVENAVGRGMFSIWWTVFAGDKDMRRRFRLAFKNTEINCFNAAEEPVCHPTGQI